MAARKTTFKVSVEDSYVVVMLKRRVLGVGVGGGSYFI